MTNIVTNRLEITELSSDNADFIVALLNSPGWLRYIGDRGVSNRADAEAYILNGPAASYKNNQFGLWLVRLKEDKAPVGICGLIKRDFLPHPDLGFAFLPQYEGAGFGYESASAVMDYAAMLLKLPVVAAITNDDNERSLKLLFKLGFNFIGMVSYPGEDEELMLLEKQLQQGLVAL